ncbi:MAG: hypothetical protein V4558_15995 [Gemmatimonadota bacterium]
MRSFASELRIGLIAGVAAGAVVLGGPRLVTALNGRSAWDDVAAPALGDPIAAARAAIAKGDAEFIVVQSPTETTIPGLGAAGITPTTLRSYRMYSPASTGLRGARWTAFEARVLPYAAAYNAVVETARSSRSS